MSDAPHKLQERELNPNEQINFEHVDTSLDCRAS